MRQYFTIWKDFGQNSTYGSKRLSFRNLLSNIVVSQAQLNLSVEGILDKHVAYHNYCLVVLYVDECLHV